MKFLSDIEINEINDVLSLQEYARQATENLLDYNKVVLEAQEIQGRCNKLTDEVLKQSKQLRKLRKYEDYRC
jgi:hypothetical protein